MSLGVSFALTSAQVGGLRACEDDGERIEWLEELEESGDAPAHLDFDKAWDALQRCLSDGTLDVPVDGEPLAHAVFGSEALNDEGDDYFIGLLPAGRVPEVANAVGRVDEAALRARFDTIAAAGYEGAADEADFQYTFDALLELQPFLAQAAQEGWAVAFTVAG